MTLFEPRFELHLNTAAVPEPSSEFLHRLESLIDYEDDIDWQDYIDALSAGRPAPSLARTAAVETDEVPF